MGIKDIHVVFSLKDQQFGISAENVLEMSILPACTYTPNMPESVRGVVNLRGRVMPVFDTRIIMGMSSVKNETEGMIKMLEQREEDHRRWIGELEGSTREGREFKLTTDPTKCAFGKWYYSFKPAGATLKMLLGRFEEPHRRIHELGVRVIGLAAEGRKDEALGLIASTHETTLKLLFDLFKELYRSMREDSREIGVVMASNGNRAIFAVDSVVAVETLAEAARESFAETVSGMKADMNISGIGKRKADQSLVFLLDASLLLGSMKSVPA